MKYIYVKKANSNCIMVNLTNPSNILSHECNLEHWSRYTELRTNNRRQMLLLSSLTPRSNSPVRNWHHYRFYGTDT